MGDSYQALVAIHYQRLRPPTGLSAFPDGGKPRILEQVARLYLVDASERAVSALTLQVAPDSLWESFSASVRGVLGDTTAFLQLTGCPRNGECYAPLRKALTLRVSTKGEVRVVRDVPPDATLPGVMLARRQGEQQYVRFSTGGSVVLARFEEGGPPEPVFEVVGDGRLVGIGG